MTKVDFNPFGTKTVIIRFKCPHCGRKIVSEKTGVPTPNYSSETARDSFDSNKVEVTCHNCNAQFDFEVWVSTVGGYVSFNIPNLSEEDVFVN